MAGRQTQLSHKPIFTTRVTGRFLFHTTGLLRIIDWLILLPAGCICRGRL